MENYISEDDCTIYHVEDFKTDKDPEREILGVIKRHLKENGTLDEIILTGHGKYCQIGSGDNSKLDIEITVTAFLLELKDIEKETGIKVANRIVFEGCGVFSKLNESDIRFLTSFAKENKMAIIGSTSKVGDWLFWHFGRFVKFDEDGKIIRDSFRDHPSNPLSYIDEDVSWTNFYIGHTANEGEEIKKTYELQRKLEAEAELKRLKNNERFGPKYELAFALGLSQIITAFPSVF